MNTDLNTYEKVLDALRCIKRHQNDVAELQKRLGDLDSLIDSIETKIPSIELNRLIELFKEKTNNNVIIFPILGDKNLLRATCVTANVSSYNRSNIDIVFRADEWSIERDIFESVVKNLYTGDCYETAVIELYQCAKKVKELVKEPAVDEEQEETILEEKTEPTSTQEDVETHSLPQTEVLQHRESNIDEVTDVHQVIIDKMTVKEKERYDKFKAGLSDLIDKLEPTFYNVYCEVMDRMSYVDGDRNDFLEHLHNKHVLLNESLPTDSDFRNAATAIIDLAISIDENNRMIKGLPKLVYGKNTDTVVVIKERHLVDLMIYFILKHDAIINRVLNTFYKDYSLDKEFYINQTYHFVAYDNYKSIITPQRNTPQLVLAVEAVNSIFASHNFNLTFYENTQLIETPNLNSDNWTNQVEIIGQLIEAFSNKGNVTKISSNVVFDVIEHIEKLQSESLKDNDLFTINPLMSNIVKYFNDTNFVYNYKDCIILRGDENKPVITVLPNIVVVSFIKQGNHSAANVYKSDKLFDVIRWLCYSIGE